MTNPHALRQFLNQSPLFAPLTLESQNWLISHTKSKTYQPQETIVFAGDPPTGLYWLESGSLKVVKQASNGREQILHFLESPQTFHEIGAFSDHPNPADIVALTTAVTWLIPRTTIQHLLQQHPTFAQHIITQLANRMHHLVTLVEDLSLRPVTARLARLLLDDAVDNTLERPRWYTQSELAARLGTVPDVIQRTLRGLAADGLITVNRRYITILDPHRLQNLTDS
ncbi:MAG TPA: Crp/Fnr family transcriptional regulator [Anaerolineae bacterium]|nr:Crp/Fnr family transcriptional regulator [Anaerolineae bacterium]